ncbi:uncharacterized protein N7443_008818 [Penicillium atrosanguineum]|uniref:uncharacterized protein n=1 Tax=Penicillium atrosanguineum TaxID=1132637 RepID=UPI00239EA48E|nr:uncharacterized protein N7443_008818 [Penicillium atrosanguineum]KAJ5292865.1 hypothetical protein N7443_008818 [Penicillium atrosanguineum]
MLHIDRDYVDIYWINCKQSTNGNTHRIIGLFNPGADRGAWYHCQGSPGAREPTYDYEKRLDSWSFESKQLISRIPTTVVNEVVQQAESIPPQDCGTWAMYLILRLEWEGLVPVGNYEKLKNSYGCLHNDEDLGPGAMKPSPPPLLLPLPAPAPRGRLPRRTLMPQQTPMPQQTMRLQRGWEDEHHGYQIPYDSKVENWLRRI